MFILATLSFIWPLVDRRFSFFCRVFYISILRLNWIINFCCCFVFDWYVYVSLFVCMCVYSLCVKFHLRMHFICAWFWCVYVWNLICMLMLSCAKFVLYFLSSVCPDSFSLFSFVLFIYFFDFLLNMQNHP